MTIHQKHLIKWLVHVILGNLLSHPRKRGKRKEFGYINYNFQRLLDKSNGDFYNLWSHLKYSTMLDTDEKNNKGFKEPQTKLSAWDVLASFFAHAFWASRLTINASTKAPCTHPLTFLDHLFHSIFKTVPPNGAILWQNCCQPLLVRPQGRGMAATIISPKPRYKGWKLASRVSNGKDISCCTCNKVQCSQLHPYQLSILVM